VKLRPTFNTDELSILKDAVGAWVALLTEEYQSKPNLEKAKRMDAAIALLDKLKGRV
jgi:hypothetical protein